MWRKEEVTGEGIAGAFTESCGVDTDVGMDPSEKGVADGGGYPTDPGRRWLAFAG